MATPFQFYRGLEANRSSETPAAGSPLWTTDEKKLYVGDGSTAGGILVGSAGGGPVTAVKTADETVTGSTTFQNDNHLSVALAANKYYTCMVTLRFEGNTTGDLKVKWSYPTGTTMLWGAQTGNSGFTGTAETAQKTFACTGSTSQMIVMTLLIDTAGTAGDLQLTWAQATAVGYAKIYQKSSMVLWETG